jgi:mannose-6-phosphate isomerase-like protein (cupin superfamily)
VPESAPFGFKLITIRAGYRTSLQYHERKEEAALVLSGEAVLFTGEIEQASVDGIRVTDGDVMHLPALVVHRIQAVTDVQLVETSTADLDDVVRLADDYARPDGRIPSEHQVER